MFSLPVSFPLHTEIQGAEKSGICCVDFDLADIAYTLHISFSLQTAELPRQKSPHSAQLGHRDLECQELTSLEAKK
jgi:hypothetical protein